MSTLDEGYCALMMKEGDTELRTARSEYPRLLAEWMAAKTFLEIVSIDGIVAVVKSAQISLIEDISSEALESWRQRQRDEDAQRLVEGA